MITQYAVTHLAGHRFIDRVCHRHWRHAPTPGVGALALWLLTTTAAAQHTGTQASWIPNTPATAQAPGTIVTIAGAGDGGSVEEGVLIQDAHVEDPIRISFDRHGNLYIVEHGGHRVRMVDTNGIITTIAGTGVSGYSGDGGPATEAKINLPDGVVVDAEGNVYIGELLGDRVRKEDTDGIITTIAGTGVGGFNGDGGLATEAQLNGPDVLILDHDGNLLVSDSDNDRVRKVDLATGIITTIAGTGVIGFSGDGGPATEAQLDDPCGIYLDSHGNLFIADVHNHRIRKVDPDGIITTVAGKGPDGASRNTYSGDGGPATEADLNTPYGILVDPAGNLFITDKHNNRVRKVDTQGIITTVAGIGPSANGVVPNNYGGDGGPAIEARFSLPIDLALDGKGNLLIADLVNDRIRMVYGVAATEATTAVAVENEGLPGSFALTAYPNPFNSSVSIVLDLPSSDEIDLGVYNLAGQRVRTLARGFREAGAYTFRWRGRDEAGTELASGVYLYRLLTGEQVETRKMLLLR